MFVQKCIQSAVIFYECKQIVVILFQKCKQTAEHKLDMGPFKDSWSIIPMLLRPKSKGNVRLRSANPYEKPIFNANYFTDQRDIDALVEGVKFALALAETQSFKKYGTRFWDGVPMPGCEKMNLWTDEYWACMCR